MRDIEFTPKEINISNIAELSKKQSALAEQRLCELYEIVDFSYELIASMLSGDYGIYEVLSLLASGLENSPSSVHTNHLEENREMLSAFMRSVDVHDKANFSKLLSNALKERSNRISEADFFDKASCEESVAFVKNQLASEAYDVFTQDFTRPRLKYVKDMKEAVSLVVKGEVGYCILPLEERGGARLSVVTETIFKDDLKINSVTPVFGPLGSADMRYALVSKHITVPELQDGDDRYLEIRLKADSSSTLSELLAVAESFDIGLYRVNTINFDTEDGAFPYLSAVLKSEGGDFTTMLIYLTLFVSDYTSVGIYKNLE